MESGVRGVTYFETVGERGIFQGDYPSRWPSDFQSVEGMIFPLLHTLRFVLKNKTFKVIRSRSSHPLKVELLALYDGHNFKIIVANFDSESQEVFFNFIKGEYSVRQLNNETFVEASRDIDWIENSSKTTVTADRGVHLSPFSVSFIAEGS